MGLGERLRAAREERGLTIEEVAGTTFIRPHHLEALEREEYHLLPASRVRYFVRDYARAVNLDPEALLAQLPDDFATPQPIAPPAPVSTPPSKPKLRREREVKSEPPVAPESLEGDDEGNGGVPAGRNRGPRYAPIEQGNPMLARGLIGVALLLIVGLGIWYFTKGDDNDTESVALASDSVEGSPTRIITADGEEGDESDTSETDIPAGDSLVLRGTFLARAWYNISIDGRNREHQGTIDSGEVREWRALESFTVDLGNAGGVRFSLNGRDLGTLGPASGTVHDRVITAEGLQGGETTTSASVPQQRRSRPRPRRQRPTTESENTPPPPQLEVSAPRESLEDPVEE